METLKLICLHNAAYRVCRRLLNPTESFVCHLRFHPESACTELPDCKYSVKSWREKNVSFYQNIGGFKSLHFGNRKARCKGFHRIFLSTIVNGDINVDVS